MKQQHHKHCWASSHWPNLRPQEREPWKEGGEEAHKLPEARAPEFCPQLSELGLAPTSLEVTEKARARHALGPRRWEFDRRKKDTKESKHLYSVPSFATNSQSKLQQVNYFLFPSLFLDRPCLTLSEGSYLHNHLCFPESLTSNLGKSVRICESLSW